MYLDIKISRRDSTSKKRPDPEWAISTQRFAYLDDDDLLVEHLVLVPPGAVAVVVVHDDGGGGDPPGDVAAQVAGALQGELRRRQLSAKGMKYVQL